MEVLSAEDKVVSQSGFPYCESKDATLNCESISPVANGLSKLLKNLTSLKKIPEYFQQLQWATYNLKDIFGNGPVFYGLPNFLFDSFYSCQLLEEHKSSTPLTVVKQESDSLCDDVSPLDLTGCPLECPFEFSHFEENGTHLVSALNGEPLKMSLLVCKTEYARLLLNAYTQELYKSLPSSTAVLFLCDGLDPIKTVLLASLKDCKSVKFIKGTKLSGIYSENGTPPISVFKNELMEMIPGQSVIKTQATAVYHIMEPKSTCSSSLRLSCQWDDPLHLLQPPSVNCLCKLDVQLFPSDEPSPLSFLYKELSVLDCIVKALSSGEIAWYIDQDNCEEETLECRLQHLIQATKEVRPSHTTQKETIKVGDSNDLKTCIEDILLTKRQHLDFTDHLWETLIKSSSYAEVKEGLTYVTKAISKGEIFPMLLRNNKTTMGCWINNHAKGSALSLDGIEPLKLLGEIGLHKLQEDYCSLFLGLELASREMLSPFLKTWEDEKAVDSLFLLHTALELVLLCKVYLHLPQYLLGEITRKVLKQYGYQDNKTYKFSFQVPLFALQTKLSNSNPDEWIVCLTSSSDALTAKIGVHFARTVLPHLRQMSLSDTTEDHQYHGTKYIFTEYYI